MTYEPLPRPWTLTDARRWVEQLPRFEAEVRKSGRFTGPFIGAMREWLDGVGRQDVKAISEFERAARMIDLEMTAPIIAKALERGARLSQNNAARAERAGRTRSKHQAEADRIWRTNQGMSAMAVAKAIVARMPPEEAKRAKPDTIRRSITKPK